MLMQKATIGVPERFLSKSDGDMRRRFFRSFKVRIPRKLKKAARFGIERRVSPKTEEKNTAVDHTYIYTENVEYVILGRRTKWKVRACFKLIKENKRRLAYMWQQECNRITMW